MADKRILYEPLAERTLPDAIVIRDVQLPTLSIRSVGPYRARAARFGY